MNEMLGNYQLREAAGTFWLIDMAQSGEDFGVPLQLNETGAALAGALYRGLDEEELRGLAAEYGIGAEQLREDAAAFAAQLAANGIRFA